MLKRLLLASAMLALIGAPAFTQTQAVKQRDTVESVHYFCFWMDSTKLGSQKCEYSIWNKTIDIFLNINPNEAPSFCAKLPELKAMGRLNFDPGWQLRISTPFSTRPVASCDL